MQSPKLVILLFSLQDKVVEGPCNHLDNNLLDYEEEEDLKLPLYLFEVIHIILHHLPLSQRSAHGSLQRINKKTVIVGHELSEHINVPN